MQKRVLLEPFDWSRKTILIADASNRGRGSWLLQLDEDGVMHIIAIKSSAWKRGQLTWSTIRKECTALIEALRDSEHFLRFCTFTLLTDHRPLLWLLRQVQLSPTMWGGAALRAVIYISQFQCVFKHIAGLANLVADILSRFPFRRDVAQTEDKRAPAWFIEALRAAGKLDSLPEEDVLVKASSVNTLAEASSGSSRKVDAGKSNSTWAKATDALADEPVHLLEMSQRLGLFRLNPNAPYDMFQILAVAKIKKEHIDAEIVKRFSDVMEEVEKDLPDLSISEGRLKYKTAFYIPLNARESVMWNAHKAPSAGHFKYETTLRNLAEFAWWPHMKEHLAEFINLCGICYRIDKDDRAGGQGVPNRMRSAFEVVELDFQDGPFPSEEGFKHRLTLIDQATRFTVIGHTKTMSADDTIDCIYKELACKYAWPKAFRCDRQPAFAAELTAKWCDFMGVRRELTAPYHPQGVAFIGASHKLQNRIMRSLLPDDQRGWYEVGPVVQKALNSFVRRNTLLSAEQLLFGFKGTSLVAALLPNLEEVSSLPEKLRLQLKLSEIVSEIEGYSRGVRISGGEEIRPRAGENRLPLKTLVGIRFRSSPQNTIAKWRVQTRGPYELLEYLNDSTVRVRHVESGTVLERAVEDLRKWVDADEPDASFEVQSIQSEQLKPNHRFLVLFRGFLQPEWVEAKNINCWERVDAFRMANPSLFPDKVMVKRVVERKKVGKTETFRVLEVGKDLDIADARWIKLDEFRNPEVISLRSTDQNQN